VFFDEKGYPWPEHHCIYYDIRLLFNQGMTADAVWEWLLEQYYRTGKPIPDDIKRFLDERRKRKTAYVNEVLPSDEPFEIQGAVREINQVNFFNRFGYIDNPITRAVLGKFVRDKYLEVVIREVEGSPDISINQATFFVLEEDVLVIHLRVGMLAYAYLNAEALDDEAVWLAEVVDRV
jgi:hypothetical protein